MTPNPRQQTRVVEQRRAPTPPTRAAPPAAARSSTHGSCAPSADQARDRCPTTAAQPAPPDEPSLEPPTTSPGKPTAGRPPPQRAATSRYPRAAGPRASRWRQCAAGLSTSNRAGALSAGSCFRRAGCISPPGPAALPLRPSARDNAEGAEPRRSAIGHRVRPTRSDVGAVSAGDRPSASFCAACGAAAVTARGRDSAAGAVSLADRAYRVFPPSPAEARAGPKAGLSGTRGWLPWHQRSSVILAAVAALRSMETRAASQLASAPHRRLSCWSDLTSQGMTRPPAATMYLRSNLFAPPAVRAARPPIELTGF